MNYPPTSKFKSPCFEWVKLWEERLRHEALVAQLEVWERDFLASLGVVKKTGTK